MHKSFNSAKNRKAPEIVLNNILEYFCAMIKNLPILLGFAIMFFACQNEAVTSEQTQSALPKLTHWPVPASGIQVASYQKAIKNDLNKGRFLVNVYTTDSTQNTGEFRMELAYGENVNNVLKIFPKWYERNVVKPLIKPLNSATYGAVIGFDPGDGTFKELFEVNVVGKDLELKQLKMYSVSY